MIKTLRCGAAGVAMFAAVGMSTAAHADTATADASAEVLEALVLTLDSGSLNFGTLVIEGGASGTVALDAANVRTCSAGIVCSGTTSVPTFVVAGTANKAVTINLPTDNVLLQHPDFTATSLGEHTIELNGFTSDANGEVTLDGAGDATFIVGGTINLDGTEVPGVFSATFDVSVEYS